MKKTLITITGAIAMGLLLTDCGHQQAQAHQWVLTTSVFASSHHQEQIVGSYKD